MSEYKRRKGWMATVRNSKIGQMYKYKKRKNRIAIAINAKMAEMAPESEYQPNWIEANT